RTSASSQPHSIYSVAALSLTAACSLRAFPIGLCVRPLFHGAPSSEGVEPNATRAATVARNPKSIPSDFKPLALLASALPSTVLLKCLKFVAGAVVRAAWGEVYGTRENQCGKGYRSADDTGIGIAR